MGCKQHRSRRNERNESNIEERREKDRERKRKRKAILRGEEISSQAIGIILNLCNFIFIDRYIIYIFIVLGAIDIIFKIKFINFCIYSCLINNRFHKFI